MAHTPRPEYHYTPARNWMNDPNGLIHHRGLWHLFYQYNPFGDGWGNMSWGHAVSPDLAQWSEQPVALACIPSEQVFSGCVVAQDDTLTAVYTAVSPDGPQAQALATSTDGGTTWTRYPGNPVLDRGSTAFRDPKVFRHDDAWVLVAVEAEKHTVVLYRSTDLRRWELRSEMQLDLGPGNNPRSRCIECPDLFPLPYGDGHRWVLVLSLYPDLDGDGSATRYFVGDFDGVTFVPSTPLRRFDDGPDCYAAASFTDAPDGRRIAIAWMSNWAYADKVPTSPWRGSMTLPRELGLVEVDGGPVLTQQPLAPREPLLLDTDVDGQAQVDGVRLAWSDGRLRLDREWFPTTVEVALPPGPLRVYADHGSVEVFSADGTVVLTALTPPRAG